MKKGNKLSIYIGEVNKDNHVQLAKIAKNLKAGDELIVAEIACLGGQVLDNLNLMEDFKTSGVLFKSEKESLVIDPQNADFRVDFLFHMFIAIAQYERESKMPISSLKSHLKANASGDEATNDLLFNVLNTLEQMTKTEK